MSEADEAKRLFLNSTGESIRDALEAQNHLFSHLNAAVDLIAADKRASLVTDVATVAQLCRSGEIMEVMDYGDQIAPAWSEGETAYNPAMNLCHEGDALLEDGETIHGAFFEWDKCTPTGVPFNAPEAIYYCDGNEGTGDHYITIGTNYGTGWKAGDHIQFAFAVAPAEGDQLVVSLGTSSDTDPTNGRTWALYAKGGTEAKDSGTTSNGASGTELGSTHATSTLKTNGRVNAPGRAVYGYNRWSQSAQRQWLNSAAAAGAWWSPQNGWNRPPAAAATLAGFLSGYPEDTYRYFKPIKTVTIANDGDDNAVDVTYDRVFLASLEQIYARTQFAGQEGDYWEYYKRLLGRTTTAPTGSTYKRLIKYSLAAPTSPVYRFLRSASRSNATSVWHVYTSGYLYTTSAYYGNRCAPSVFLSD